MKAQLPTVSVITVVYNARDLIEGTIDSVLAQTYPHLEYVIVDGASTDGTLELIGRYADRIDRLVSEPDRGLYDAMNKGLEQATGDFVWYINAGDRIFASDTLERVMEHYRPEVDVLYGEVMLVDDRRRQLGTRSELTVQKLPARLSWRSLRRGMVVCHQGFLARRELAPPYRLDNLTADIEWVIRILQRSRGNVHTQLILAEYLQGGLSKKKHRQFMRDRYAVLRKYYGFLPNLLNHLLIVGRAAWWRIVRMGKDRY